MDNDWQIELLEGQAEWIERYSSVTLPAWLEECLPTRESEDYSRARDALLRARYSRWLELVESYEDDPEDFVNSFNFVSRHPAFWTRRADEPTYSWKTSEHHLKLWFQVSTDARGNTQFLFETGGHVEPHYLDTYHDTRLDTVSSSYEEGIVKLANSTRKLFNSDGTARVGFEVRRV